MTYDEAIQLRNQPVRVGRIDGRPHFLPAKLIDCTRHKALVKPQRHGGHMEWVDLKLVRRWRSRETPAAR
jgi:hypothetical protein